MIKQIAIMVFAATAALVQAQELASVVGIDRAVLGSGTPGKGGIEVAQPVLQNDIFHAPQYMPYYPTAAVIYPRVVDVPCAKTPSGDVICDSYSWQPKMGRGEYLFFTPHFTAPVVQPTPQVVVVPGPTVTIIKEVPRKPKDQ